MWILCRVTLCIARPMSWRRVSFFYPSVTFVYCLETAKRIITFEKIFCYSRRSIFNMKYYDSTGGSL